MAILPTLPPLPAFWRHLLTVLGGSLAAQALPILAAPLITRLCTPAELGAFSLWFGVVAIAAVAATLRMENAMIIDHGPGRQLLCLGVVRWSATWLALLLTMALAGARLAGWITMSWTGVLTLGAAAWLTASMQTMLAYAASHNAFAPAARARIVAAGGVAAAQLMLLVLLSLLAGPTLAALPGQATAVDALLAGHLLGLAAGLLAAHRLLPAPAGRLPAGHAAAWTPTPTITETPASASKPARHLLQRWQQCWQRLQRRHWRALLPTPVQRRYLQRHRAFWYFSLPSNLLNAAVGQLPLLIIGARHGVMAAGLFALTQRVLAAPISLLASSVLEVFKRESVRQYQQQGDCRPAYLHALRVLLALGIVPALVLLVASPMLFRVAFGADWRGAGELAQLLAPLFFLNFVASPLSYVFFVAGRQKIELLWQVALFLTTIAAFAAPLTLKQNVLAYSIAYSLLYLLYLHMSYRYARSTPAQRSSHAAG
ncbi:MAG: oligosaccharide flippase family protein [Duganella sp.]